MAYCQGRADDPAPPPPVLIALLLVTVAMLAGGPAAAYLPTGLAPRLGIGLAALGILLAAAGTLLGPDAVGLAGLGARLDGLSGFFILPILLALSPALLTDSARGGPVAGLAILAVLGQGVVTVLALAGLCLALRVRRIEVGVGALFGALATVMPLPDTVWPAALAGLGVGALWVGAAEPVLGVLGVYLLARLGLGPTLPMQAGLAMLGLGMFGAVLGAVRAALSGSFRGALPGFGAFSSGLACAGLGVTMAARGADLLPVATLGLQASLLGLLVQSLAIAAIEIAAAAVPAGGSGLWRSMPATGLSAFIGLSSLAALPPAAGFSSTYLLLQSLLGAHRIGGVAVQFTLALAIAATGLAIGLAGVAGLRVLGTAFLGRMEGAAGLDPRGDIRVAMAALAGLGALFALAPAAPLLLADAAVTAAGLPRAPLLIMPTALAALIALAFAAGWAVLRAAPSGRRVEAWEGGLPPTSDMAPYVPGLVSTLPRLRLRAPTLHECVAAAALALAIVLIVLAAS